MPVCLAAPPSIRQGAEPWGVGGRAWGWRREGFLAAVPPPRAGLPPKRGGRFGIRDLLAPPQDSTLCNAMGLQRFSGPDRSLGMMGTGIQETRKATGVFFLRVGEVGYFYKHI